MQTLRYSVFFMVWFNVLLAGWLSMHMLYDPEGCKRRLRPIG